jgi:predicted Zn-dependent protease
MRCRVSIVRFRASIAAALIMLAFLASLLPGAAAAQGPVPRIITIRDAETESLIRRLANPLFRTAGVDPTLVRITLIQNRAINAFVSTGNRMFVHTGLIQQSTGAAEVAGVLAHETGHIAGGHLLRLPDETIVHTGHGDSTTIGAERPGVLARAAELGL